MLTTMMLGEPAVLLTRMSWWVVESPCILHLLLPLLGHRSVSFTGIYDSKS